jgi:hypothetical protein
MRSARIETLRIQLSKIGARILETARCIRIHLASGWPFQDLFQPPHSATLLSWLGLSKPFVEEAAATRISAICCSKPNARRPPRPNSSFSRKQPKMRSLRILVQNGFFLSFPFIEPIRTLGIRSLPEPDLWTGYNGGLSRLYAKKDLIPIHPVEDQPTNCKHRQSFEQRLQSGASDREGMGTQVDVEGRN